MTGACQRDGKRWGDSGLPGVIGREDIKIRCWVYDTLKDVLCHISMRQFYIMEVL